MQDDFTPERVAAEALPLLLDRDAAARMRRDLQLVRSRLGEPGASARAARAVVEVAAGRSTSLG